MKLINFIQPVQYTNYELNIPFKEWKTDSYKILLIFPDTYDIGMSHYGFNLIFNHLNNLNNVIVDRAFLPQKDYYKYLINNNLPLKSLHYKKNFHHFDFIGFSISYELSYMNIIAIFKIANINIYKNKRDNNSPIIACGGTSSYNPEILKKVFDFIYIGDSENRLNEIIKTLINSNSHNKSDKINTLKKYDNIFIPDIKETATKYSTPELTADFYKQPVPLCKTVHNRGVVEIMRGCLRNCRFCQAGYIYRPFRFISPNDILELTKNIYFSTGYEEISYLSLSSSDYPHLNELINILLPFIIQHKISISFPSQRIDKLDKQLCKFLNQNKKSGLTLAVEAGSERLRKIINKNISNDEILNAINTACERGWRKIKLYFMIGLPYETDEDVKAIVSLVQNIVYLYGKKILSLNISVSNFVPKPFTPFQYHHFEDINSLNQKLFFLRNNLKSRKIKFSWSGPVQSKLEYLMSNGDSDLFNELIHLYNINTDLILQDRGEYFNKSVWNDFVNNYKSITHKNNIKIDVTNAYLEFENQKAKEGIITETCLNGKCVNCGIKNCKIKNIKSLEYTKFNIDEKPIDIFDTKYKYRIEYQKLDNLKYLSSLDMQTFWYRVLRKSNIRLAYSQGYNKKPLLIFSPAIPLGITSLKEYVDFTAIEQVNINNLQISINKYAKDRIYISNIYPLNTDSKDINKNTSSIKYKIVFNNEDFHSINKNLENIVTEKIVVIEKIKKGVKKIKNYNTEEFIIDYKFIKKEFMSELLLILRIINGESIPLIKFLNQLISLDRFIEIIKLDIS